MSTTTPIRADARGRGLDATNPADWGRIMTAYCFEAEEHTATSPPMLWGVVVYDPPDEDSPRMVGLYLTRAEACELAEEICEVLDMPRPVRVRAAPVHGWPAAIPWPGETTAVLTDEDEP